MVFNRGKKATLIFPQWAKYDTDENCKIINYNAFSYFLRRADIYFYFYKVYIALLSECHEIDREQGQHLNRIGNL